MRQNTSHIFILDSLTTLFCSGWYLPTPGHDNAIIVEIGSKAWHTNANMERPDVAAAGWGVSTCGFRLDFEDFLEEGSEVLFKNTMGQELYRAQLPRATQIEQPTIDMPFDAPAIPISLMESFTDMHMARAKHIMVQTGRLEEIKEEFAIHLQKKSGQERILELVDILADIKTTLHLLGAAYLDYTRYKEPISRITIPRFPPDREPSIVIDMQENIIGANWSEPQANGRWMGAGSRSSLLFPAPAPGRYRLSIEICGTQGQNAINLLSVRLNGERTTLEKLSAGPHFRLSGSADIADEPFIALHFQFDSPQKNDAGRPSVLVRSVCLARED